MACLCGAALAGWPSTGWPSTGWPPPNSRHGVTITPALRNKVKKALPTGQEKTRAQKHQSMIWAQRLKRVFGIDIETGKKCGGAVKVIASIEPTLMIQKILSHLNIKMTKSSKYCPTKSRNASDKSV
jgi:hypothetical protein